MQLQVGLLLLLLLDANIGQIHSSHVCHVHGFCTDCCVLGAMDQPTCSEEDPIDPETACAACGSQDSPETMIICDNCQQGHHLVCFGLASIPEDEQWMCQGCAMLLRLIPGSQLVLECAQPLYGGSEPHLTQAMFSASVSTIEASQRDSWGVLRQAQLDISNAPLPGSVRFFSIRTHKPLKKVPAASHQLRDVLYTRTGTQSCPVSLRSSRYSMFGSCAAAAGISSEAWLAGTGAEQAALQLLAGPPRQLYLLEHSSAAGSSSSSGKSSSRIGSVTATAAASATEAPSPQQRQLQQQQATLPTQQQQAILPTPQQQQPAALAALAMPSLQQDSIQHPYAPPSATYGSAPYGPPTISSSMPTAAVHMGPPAAQYMMPNLMPHPAASNMQAAPVAQPYGMPHQPVASPAPPHQLPHAYPPPAPYGYYHLPGPLMVMPGTWGPPWGPWGWPGAVPAVLAGGAYGYAAVPPALPPADQQQQQLWQQQAQAVAPPVVAAPSAADVGRQGRKVAKKGRQQLLVEAAHREDEDEDAACTSDDDFLPPPSQGAGPGATLQVAKVVFKVNRASAGCSAVA